MNEVLDRDEGQDLSPSQWYTQTYHRQIAPVALEHTVQMISARLSGDIGAAKNAVGAKLAAGVAEGTIDSEMAEIAKEEFSLSEANTAGAEV